MMLSWVASGIAVGLLHDLVMIVNHRKKMTYSIKDAGLSLLVSAVLGYIVVFCVCINFLAWVVRKLS